MKRIIIAGSRDVEDVQIVVSALIDSGFIQIGERKSEIEIVSGGARGVDSVGEYIAKVNGFNVRVFPADWKTHGKAAGPIRNEQMGDYADFLVAVRKDNSRGTTHMINYMKKLGKPVFVRDL